MTDDKRPIFKVAIAYKSGTVITHRMVAFSVTSDKGVITELRWELVPGEPKILFIGVNDIESVTSVEEQC